MAEEKKEQSAPELSVSPAENNTPETERLEVWVYVVAILALMMLVFWGIVFMRLGTTSIRVLTQFIPTLSMMTIPVLTWGVFRSFVKPPALRKSRAIAFVVALGIGILGMEPLIPAPLSTENWKQDFALKLPFQGEWYTTQGGDDPNRNYHNTTPAHRWAYDFVVRKDGKTYALDGKKNEDYYCFGKQILSPVRGKIIQAENDEPDNENDEIPATLERARGNYVVIRVKTGVFIFLQHLKHQSLKVEIGDQVEIGQVIGGCGNSGRSYRPHLQIHAQNTEGFPIAESLPIIFDDLEKTPIGETGWRKGDGTVVNGKPSD
jgi:hypothetical protein